MKYIKTKDGVFEISSYEKVVTDSGVDYIINHNKGHCFPEDVIKQDNSLKKLCDVFVLHKFGIIRLEEDNKHYRFDNDDELFELNKLDKRIGIYGGIWFEGGIKYVCKMNEERDFKLI